MALIPDKIIGLLQTRIQHEEANSKAYTAMQNWLSLNGFEGAAKLWGKYAEDEKSHKDWSKNYLLDLNILPIEPSEEQPQTEFKGLPNIIALSMQRELNTTKEVKELALTCLAEQDLMTFGLAQKYIAEQVEEISKLQSHIDFMNSFGDTGVALKLLDKKMGELAA